MLGNPRTHIRNIVGNTIFIPMRALKDLIGAGLEKAVKVEQSKRTKTVLNPIKDKEYIDAGKKSFETVKAILQNTDKYGERDIYNRRRIFNTRFLETARKLNFKALELEDVIFMKSAYVNSYAQAMKARGFAPSETANANGVFDKGVGTKEHLATQSDINDYVDFALEYGRQHKELGNKDFRKQKNDIRYAKTDESLVLVMREEYGIDLDGKYHALNDNDIRHIHNSHGENTNEKYPVTREDLKRIPDIVKNYDDVLYVPRNKEVAGIVYVKQHNGVTYYLEQIVDGDILKNKQMIKVPTGTIPNISGIKNAVNKKWNIVSGVDDSKIPACTSKTLGAMFLFVGYSRIRSVSRRKS